MTTKISVTIPFYQAATLLCGNLQVKLLAHKTANGLLVFSPFGFWIWTTAGYLPPVAEYWRKTQEGSWAWQIDNPSLVHIMLYQGENVVGVVSDFKRNDLETRKRLTGYWILNEGTNEDSGNYDRVSVGYEYT